MTAQYFKLVLAGVMLGTAAHASTIFNFDDNSLGTATGFTDTANGLSATFSSSADPGGFVVYGSMFNTLTGNVLGDPGPAGFDNLALDIAFSSNLSSANLDFATSDFNTASSFTLTAYEGSKLVGSASSTGSFIPGFSFPEGQISFAGHPFDNIVVSSTATDFAIDNISVTSAPEPSAFSLLALGLLGVLSPRLYSKLKRRTTLFTRATSANLAAAFFLLTVTFAQAQSTHSIFPLLPPSVSTIPSNGDINPYGVAFAPKTLPTAGGLLQPGDILVSNFNSSFNLQGTGTTITRVDSTGKTSTFYTSPSSRSGPSAAIGILTDGFVLVGNVPTVDGSAATLGPGTLSVLDRNANFLGTFGSPATVDGPWGMAIHDIGSNGSGAATVFLSNVLSGTISRFSITYSPTAISATDMVLATGFTHRVDPAALVLGPSGLAYDATHDILYVASSSDNAVYEIQKAAATQTTATLLFQDFTHLHGPLDLAILPNGHFLIANSDGSNLDPAQPSELVEFTPQGTFLAQMSIDPLNGGAFGLATMNLSWGTFRWASVDDNKNTLNIWTSVAQ